MENRAVKFHEAGYFFVLLCLGVFLFILFFHQGIETEDVWLHLSTGRWILQHHQMPHEDVFPFLNEKTPYLCHEWISSVFIYSLYKIQGFLGLKIFRPLFFLLSLGIFFFYARRRIPFSFLTFLILLISYAFFQRSLLRPDILNVLFVQLFLMVLFSYQDNPKPSKLFLLPLMGVFWVNMHMMGAFVYGEALIFIFLMAGWARGFQQGQALAWSLLAFMAVFMINPYGFEGVLFPYKVLLFPKYYGLYQMMGMMKELQAPIDIFFSLDYLYFLILMAVPVVLFFLDKKKDLVLVLLYGVALLMFLSMARNCIFFTVVAAYVMARQSQNLGLMKIWGSWSWRPWVDFVLCFFVVFVSVTQAYNFFHEKVYFNGQIHQAMLLDTNPYVIKSINLLKDNGVKGPVFNSSPLGGVILWFDYPALKPFDDGRHLDYGRVHDEINVYLNPSKEWDKAQKKYGFKIVILSQGNISEQKVIRYLCTRMDWQFIAVNGPFVIFVKKGEVHLSDDLAKFEERLKSEVLSDSDRSKLNFFLNQRSRPVLDQFLWPSAYRVDTFSTGLALMGLGYKEAAAKNFIQALEISDQPYMREIVAESMGQFK
ncbi:MAG: hypothetical protein HQL13_00120 [Candidatus Omnitrophica bacterium]|nr:hypothetical protein [Candidatus Omnitrophota bacterium]